MTAEPLWRQEYPFASHYLSLTGGHRLHYLDEGPRDATETLLLVHGNPTWSFYWRHLVAGLRSQYRMVVPDHLGCGLSDKPQAYPYRLASHVGNLARLVDDLDLKNMTLVAHDWGGAIGLGVATSQPERFARLVLMNTAGFRSTRIPWRIAVCRTPGFGKLALQGLNAFTRAALRMALARPRQLSPAARAGYLAPYDNWANRIAIYHFVQDIPLSERHPSYAVLQAIEQGLSQLVHLPCLLPWGMQDWCFTPHFLRRFQEFFPAAQTLELPQAGHWVAEEASRELVTAIREFVESHPLQESTRR